MKQSWVRFLHRRSVEHAQWICAETPPLGVSASCSGRFPTVLHLVHQEEHEGGNGIL